MKFTIGKFDKDGYSLVTQKLDELKTNNNYKRNFDCYFIEEKVTSFADKFVVFNDEYYAINDDKNSDEYFYNKFYLLKSESEFNDLVDRYKITNLYKRDSGGYMVGFNNNTFICFSQMSTDSGLNSPNVFKILFLQILSISYRGLNQEFIQNLQNIDNKFDGFDDEVVSSLTSKIYDFRLKETSYDLYKSHIGDETYEIYKMIVEYFDFKNTFEKVSQVFQEIFAVKTREYEIKNIKLQNDFNEHIKNLLEEQKKQTLEREKQSKKMNKFVMLATFITILTFISVIADIFNLWDRIKVIF